MNLTICTGKLYPNRITTWHEQIVYDEDSCNEICPLCVARLTIIGKDEIIKQLDQEAVELEQRARIAEEELTR